MLAFGQTLGGGQGAPRQLGGGTLVFVVRTIDLGKGVSLTSGRSRVAHD